MHWRQLCAAAFWSLAEAAAGQASGRTLAGQSVLELVFQALQTAVCMNEEAAVLLLQKQEQGACDGSTAGANS